MQTTKSERREPIQIRRKPFYEFVKRVFDVVSSACALVVCALPMCVIAWKIKRDSPGDAIYKQERLGLNGKPFMLYKFRSMRVDAPGNVPTSKAQDIDCYITPFGHFLRRTSLDELPQLWNVLKGDMSVVGPRPLIKEETDVHEIRSQANVYTIKPGITGWAQINGRDMVDDETKAKLDAYYFEHRSLLFDLKIIFYSVFKVLSEDGIAGQYVK